MAVFTKILYEFFIRFFWMGANVYQLFSTKTSKWVKGRKNWRTELLSFVESNSKRIIWIHASSLGEFEQARPIIERIKIDQADFAVVCTFFSPSGYEVRKNYPHADWVTYIPLDTQANADFWLDNLKPILTIFIKYDVWPNMVKTLNDRGVKTILVCASFRENQFYFKKYGAWFLSVLKLFSHIYLANQASYDLLKQKGFENITLSGDTRYDRVVANATNPQIFPNIERFIKGQKVLVCGSTWQDDEQLIHQLYKSGLLEGWKLIIAPHEVSKSHVSELQNLFEFKVILESELNANSRNLSVLIVDSIGKLASIYQYADMTYIGGGFSAGIHNILEAAVFGSPVIFGPKYKKFTEAVEMVEADYAIPIQNFKGLKKAFKQFHQQDLSTSISKFVINKTGATNDIMAYVNEICNNG